MHPAVSTFTVQSAEIDHGCDEKLGIVHEEAEELFQQCAKLKNESGNWDNASSNKKLIYYWAAINSEVPKPNPFENFSAYLVKKKKKRGDVRNKRKAQNLWHTMRFHEKMPFIAESLISSFNRFGSKYGESLECNIKGYMTNARKDYILQRQHVCPKTFTDMLF